MGDLFTELSTGNPVPLTEWLEGRFRDNVVDDRPLTINDLYESSFRIFVLYELREGMPDGWSAEHEVEDPRGWRRADIVLTDPDGLKIMLELKYVQPNTVVYPGCADDSWKIRATAGFQAIEDADSILDLEFKAKYAQKTTTVGAWVTTDEFEPCARYGKIKFDETMDMLDIEVGYVIVGVGPRLVSVVRE